MNQALPEDLSDHQLCQILLGKEKIPLLAQEPWSNPKKLAVDAVIERLIERPKGAIIRMRPRKELEKGAWPMFCPFLDARYFILAATQKSRSFVEAWRFCDDSIVPRLAQKANAAEKLIRHLDNFLQGAPAWPFVGVSAGITLDMAGEDWLQTIREAHTIIFGLYISVAALKESLAEFRERSLRVRGKMVAPHTRGQVWRQTFVECLARYFYFLTGCQPKSDNLFAAFADACYESLGGTCSLQAPIKTVLARIDWPYSDEDRRPSLNDMFIGKPIGEDEYRRHVAELVARLSSLAGL